MKAAYRDTKKLVYDSTLCINKIFSDLADNWHREFFSISTWKAVQDKDLYLTTKSLQTNNILFKDSYLSDKVRSLRSRTNSG